MPNFENEQALLELELKRRHQAELDEFLASIEQGTATNSKIHFSNTVLDLQKKMEYLSAQGCYKEAKEMKKKLKKAKNEETQKFMDQLNLKLHNKSQQMIARHKRELEGFKKRQSRLREQMLTQRKKEFEVHELRFVNVWNEMEAKFKKELIALDKFSVVKKMEIKASNRAPTAHSAF